MVNVCSDVTQVSLDADRNERARCRIWEMQGYIGRSLFRSGSIEDTCTLIGIWRSLRRRPTCVFKLVEGQSSFSGSIDI